MRKLIDLTENKYVVDSSAWIEYLRGSELGIKVKSIIEDRSNTCLTPNIVAAEVISKVIRANEDEEKAIQAIKTFSSPLEGYQEIYFEAGKLHPELRKMFKNIGIADVIIKIFAEKNNARIITKDLHLKSKNAIFLE